LRIIFVVVVVNVLRIVTLPHPGLSKFAFGLWWLSSVWLLLLFLLLLLSLKTIVIRLDGRFLQPNTFVVPNVREYRISSSIITPWMRRSPVRRFWALQLEGIVVVGLLAPTTRVGTTRVGRQGMQRPLHLPTKTNNQANNQRTAPHHTNKQRNGCRPTTQTWDSHDTAWVLKGTRQARSDPHSVSMTDD